MLNATQLSVHCSNNSDEICDDKGVENSLKLFSAHLKAICKLQKKEEK